MSKLNFAPYIEQQQLWPSEGNHILASYNEETIVVYQAYHAGIASYAIEHQRFGDNFSLNRMTWIKPNFLWMMYRSGWGTKPNQEMILAIYLKPSAFLNILGQAVHSQYHKTYENKDQWKLALKKSDVRLQWDPDHDPYGKKQDRRAIQLGIKGNILQHYVTDWIVEIVDLTSFVAQQREILNQQQIARLQVPTERVFPIGQENLRQRIGCD